MITVPPGYYNDGLRKGFIRSGRASVTPVAKLLVAESKARIGVVITNIGAGIVYIGAAGVDLANDGHCLPSLESLMLYSNAEVYAASDAGGPYPVSWLEEYTR